MYSNGMQWKFVNCFNLACELQSSSSQYRSHHSNFIHVMCICILYIMFYLFIAIVIYLFSLNYETENSRALTKLAFPLSFDDNMAHRSLWHAIHSHTHTHTKASRVVRRQRWPAPAEESAWCWDSTRSTHTVTDIHRDAPPAHDFSLNQVVSWIDFWFNIKIKAYIITYIYLYMCEWVYTCVYCYVVMWKCIMCSSLCCGGICANVCEFSVRRRDMRFGLNYQNETNEKDGWVLPANLWIQPVVGWESKAQSVFNHTHTHIHHCTSRSTLTSAYMTWPEVM